MLTFTKYNLTEKLRGVPLDRKGANPQTTSSTMFEVSLIDNLQIFQSIME